MNEIVIKRDKFDEAKNRLRERINNDKVELKIPEVKEKGLLFKRASADDINNSIQTIQANFIEINKINNETTNEFREIYKTIDVLDKEYITGIVSNVKAIEKTSNDVRNQQETLEGHHKKLKEQQRELDNHQKEIGGNVDNISKIVDVLHGFKEELEKYKHLYDIDGMWDKLTECEKRDEEFTAAIQKHKEEVTENIAELKQTTNVAIDALTKKVKYAYWFAGGSACFAVIELILLLMQVI